MSLPFLPGYSVIDNTRATTAKKKQTLIFKNGYAIPNPDLASTPLDQSGDIGTMEITFNPELTYTGTLKNPVAQRAPKTAKAVPSETSLVDRHVLHYDAYFLENVVGSSYENERARKVEINFYTEDGTLMINERKVPNSGIPQGCILKRQKITTENGNLTWKDIRLSQDLTIYGRTYRIVDCNPYTRSFYTSQKQDIGTPEDFPEDKHEEVRKRIDSPPKTTTANPNKALLKKFMETDGKVLRFSATWDNTSKGGDARPYTIHYFLVDNSVEVREVHSQNNGYMPFPALLKRQKLPKLEGGFVQDLDIRVGEILNVYGRDFFIHDCDEFTKSYYRQKFGVEIVSVKFESTSKPSSPAPTAMRSTTASFYEAPPKKNFNKQLENEKKILRFAASLQSDKPEDRDRKFIISYFTADDTVSVYEPPQKNSGIGGGKFLERRQVLKPKSQVAYISADFAVGAVIDIFTNKFLIQSADEYALNFMEANPEDYPQSDVHAIIKKMKELMPNEAAVKRGFTKYDKDGNGHLSVGEFREAALSLGMSLTEQEVLTIVRRYDLNGDGVVSYDEFVLAIRN